MKQDRAALEDRDVSVRQPGHLAEGLMREMRDGPDPKRRALDRSGRSDSSSALKRGGMNIATTLGRNRTPIENCERRRVGITGISMRLAFHSLAGGSEEKWRTGCRFGSVLVLKNFTFAHRPFDLGIGAAAFDEAFGGALALRRDWRSRNAAAQR